MTREEKAAVIEELKEKLANNPYFYVMDAAGMTVAETNAFRRLCYNRDIEYKVYKNTLIKKALDSLDADYTPFEEKVLKGFSGLLFSQNSGSSPAKLIKEFRKKGNEKPLFKGASVDASLFIGEENLEALTKIKSKQDVIAELVGLLQSPGRNLVSALKTPGQKMVGVLQSQGSTLAGLLKALQEKKEKEG